MMRKSGRRLTALGKGFAPVGSDSGLEPCLLQEMGFQLQHVTVALDNQNQ